MEELSNWNLDKVYETIKSNPDINIKKETFSYYHKYKTKNKTVNLSLGKIWFNCLLPDDYEFIDYPVDAKKMNAILSKMRDKYSPQELSDIISNIQKHSFYLATINPKSFNHDAFVTSDEWKKKKEEFIKNIDKMSLKEYEQKKKELTEELFENAKRNNNPIIDILDSKSSSKVSKDTWGVLQVSKGITSDLSGNIHMIPEAIGDGYTVENYYKAANESRQGFYIKSTAVRDPGYLARKAIMATAGIEVTKKDCLTKRYLELLIDENTASRIIGRFYLNEKTNNLVEINDDNKKDIIGKTIKLRSPLFCKDKNGICPVCYGRLAEKLNTQRIGILAGSAMNNEAINAMMKLRHKADKVKIVEINFIEILKKFKHITGDLSSFLDIKEKEIYSNVDELIIYIDKQDYDENTLSEYDNYFEVPGLLQFQVGETSTELYNLPFNFDVKLYKPKEFEGSGRILKFIYYKGEIILSKENYIKTVNPAIITKLLDGVTKYIKDPVVLLNMLSEELTSTDLVHLELIVSNMCRNEDNLKEPARLTNYKKFKIVGCKKIPFIDSWLNSLAFENINKAITTGLIEVNNEKLNPIESLILRETFKDFSDE